MVLTCCGASVDEIVTDYARCGLNWKSLKLTPITCFGETPSWTSAAALWCGCMRRWGALRRSDDVGAVALGGMEKEELKGLDVAVFSRAPPQALLATLEHLRCSPRCSRMGPSDSYTCTSPERLTPS